MEQRFTTRNGHTSMVSGVKCARCGRIPPYWTDIRLKNCGKCTREMKESKEMIN